MKPQTDMSNNSEIMSLFSDTKTKQEFSQDSCSVSTA